MSSSKLRRAERKKNRLKTLTIPINHFVPQEGVQAKAFDIIMDGVVQDILYGGARGGGKTFLCAICVSAAVLRWGKKFRAVFFRYKYVDLAITIDKCRTVWEGMGKYNKQTSRFTFYNGAYVDFRHLQTDSMSKLQGGDYVWAFIEEITEIPNIDGVFFAKIYGSLRSEFGIPTKLIMSTNPGDVSHKIIKERYVDNGEFVITEIAVGEGTRKVVFIPARVEDNKILLDNDPNYINALLAGDERLIDMWYRGKWDIHAGKAFSLDNCIVAHGEALKLRSNPFYVGIDWGYRPHPCFAVFVKRIDNSTEPNASQWLVVHEEEFFETAPAEVAITLNQSITDIGGSLIYAVIDPSANASDNGKSVRYTFDLNGLQTFNANNERKAGLQNLTWLLKSNRLFISEGCPKTIACLSNLVLKNDGHYDVAPYQNDHAYDALRYVGMAINMY